VRIVSSTRIPPRFPSSSPASLASPTSGRTPMERITKSAGIEPPSRVLTTTAPSSARSKPATASPSRKETPLAERRAATGSAISGSKGGKTCGRSSTSVIERPRRTRFSTISRPMKPPPTTTARAASRSTIHWRMRRLSGMVRSTKIPGRSMPGRSGLTGEAPGASTSASYLSRYFLPERSSTTSISRAALSIASTSFSVLTSMLKRCLKRSAEATRSFSSSRMTSPT